MNNVKQGQTGSNKVPWTAGPWQKRGTRILYQKNPGGYRFDIAEVFRDVGGDTAKANARLIASSPCLAAFVAAIAGSVKCSESESGKAAPEAVDGWIDHARALLARIEGE